MKTRNKIILIAIIPVVGIASIVMGPVIFMIGANGYAGFIISSTSNEVFEKNFAKIPEVQFFIEKYPNYTTGHLSDFLGWKIIDYNAELDTEKSIHLSVKKSVLHGKVKVSAACDAGGSAYFQTSSYQLEEGNFWDRTHLRMFQGSYDTHGTYDNWSIAGVHEETLQWVPGVGLDHVINSWEDAETELRDDLSGKTDVGTIGNYNTNYSGELQEHDFDQYAAQIELT